MEPQSQHPGTFPDQLASDFIRCFCPPGGMVLDPFVGSGTTAVAARNLNRRHIGIDISPDYCRLAQQRLSAEKSS